MQKGGLPALESGETTGKTLVGARGFEPRTPCAQGSLALPESLN